MNIYKVDDSGDLQRIPVSGMKVEKIAGRKKKIEFDVEFRVFYEPNPEQGSVDVRIEFPSGKHWEGVEQVGEGIMSDIAAAAGSVREAIAEQWPGMSVGEISTVVVTSDMSAVPDLFEIENEPVINPAMQAMLDRQKRLREERDPLVQTGPAGPSTPSGLAGTGFNDAGGEDNDEGGGRMEEQRETKPQ